MAAQRAEVMSFALRYRLPLVSPYRAYVGLGGLLSYGRRDEPTSGWENLVARDQARPAGTPLVAR